METTLYNNYGYPVVYIADNAEKIIYTWTGEAVAYIYADLVFSLDGCHLGWFEDGIIYNADGERLGSIKDKCRCIASVEPIKSIKTIQSYYGTRETPNAKPVFSLNDSKIDLLSYLDPYQE